MPKLDPRSWETMLFADTRALVAARIRKDSPQVAAALDFLSSRYSTYDGYGFTVFTDWLLHFMPKAAKHWPETLPRFEPHEIYNVVFKLE